MEYRTVGKFQSARSGEIYTVKRNETEDLSCDCPGWIHHRTCKHVNFIQDHGEMAMVKKYPNYLEARELEFGRNAEKVKKWNEENPGDIPPRVI